MKANYLWSVLIALLFIGCDDTTSNVGLNVLPETDGIDVHTVKFPIAKTSSTASGAVYARTSTGYVGRFTDTEFGFGYYEGSFLTQLNCIDDMEFPKPYDPATNRDPDMSLAGDLDEAFLAAQVHIGYYSYFGDSLNPMKISIYELDKDLEANNYTNIEPENYVGRWLGSKTITAIDLADSTKKADDPYFVSIPLPDEFGKDIIRHNWTNPEDFKNSDTFVENVLKGIYVKSETGDGTILYVDHLELELTFNQYVLDSVGDLIPKHDESGDSTAIYLRAFASTREVIQANQIVVSEDEINAKVTEYTHTYLKSPAGIWTKAVLPISDVLEEVDLKRDTINAVKLTFTGYQHKTTNEFSMSPPTTLLMIREKEVDEFFEENKLPNNTTSYLTGISNNQYTFNNITRLITTCAKELEEAKKEQGSAWNQEAEDKWHEENAIVIIPVTVSMDQSSYTSTIKSVQHDLRPAFIKLQGGDPQKGGTELELHVVYSRFKQ